MKTFAALAALMTFVAPSMAQTHVPGPNNEAAVNAFDCWIELQEVAQAGDPCLPSNSDIELILVFEIDELTGEVFGPVDLLMVANTEYGEEVLAQIEHEMAVEPTFDPWSWQRVCEDHIVDTFVLDEALSSAILWDETPLPSTAQLARLQHYKTFGSTLCAAKSGEPVNPAPKERPCHPNEPAITNDEALKIMIGIAAPVQKPEFKPRTRTPKGTGKASVQDAGRRNMMTSRAG